jgi:acyl-CoA hydrolase
MMTKNNRIIENIENRIRCEKLLEKVVKAVEAVWLIEDGMTMATSGFTLSSLSSQ